MHTKQHMPAMSPRIAKLRRDHRGFPVPWFVQWFDHGRAVEPGQGEPDFRCIDERKLGHAVRHHCCWVCGERLGAFKTFAVGPMCAITRAISEPPSHYDCAEFSARACPFLTRPRMRRNEVDLPAQRKPAPGMPIPRNPGAVCLWTTKSFRTFHPKAGNEGLMFALGEPTSIAWFAEGRPATRQEVMDSIESGYPILLEQAEREGANAVAELQRQRNRVLGLLPQPQRVSA